MAALARLVSSSFRLTRSLMIPDFRVTASALAVHIAASYLSSRAAWCSACAPGRSQPCYSSQSPFVGRSVGGLRHAPTAGKRPVPARSGARVAAFPSEPDASRRGSPRCARTAPDSPRRVVACHNYELERITATHWQSRKAKGVSGWWILAARC